MHTTYIAVNWSAILQAVWPLVTGVGSAAVYHVVKNLNSKERAVIESVVKDIIVKEAAKPTVVVKAPAPQPPNPLA